MTINLSFSKSSIPQSRRGHNKMKSDGLMSPTLYTFQSHWTSIVRVIVNGEIVKYSSSIGKLVIQKSTWLLNESWYIYIDECKQSSINHHLILSLNDVDCPVNFSIYIGQVMDIRDLQKLHFLWFMWQRHLCDLICMTLTNNIYFYNNWI